MNRYASTTVATGGATTVLGDCAPAGGPTMMKYVGATALTDVFFVRDLGTTDNSNGLKTDLFDPAYKDCDHGGWLDDQLGVIYVR